MVDLTFYGGVNEIGGNKILVESDDGTVLLDFGRRMGLTGEYYSEFLQVRSNSALRDFLRLGILPEIDGIYNEPYLDSSTMLTCPVFTLNFPIIDVPDYWIYEGISPYDMSNPRVNGVFISHAHFDHIQDISFLNPKIPVYCSAETRVLANAICDVSTMHIDDQFFGLKREQKITPMVPDNKSDFKTVFHGELDLKEVSEDPKPIIIDDKTKFPFTHEHTQKTRDFYTDQVGKVRNIEYKLIPVGHSVPGACSVLLTFSDNKRILYTGDLRFHGTSGPTIDEYVTEVDGPIEAIIIEGTRIEQETILEETKIQESIKKDMEKKSGLILINFNWKDLSRFNIVHKVVQDLDRILVINPKIAYLLFEMHLLNPGDYPDPRTMSNLLVYVKREKSLLYSKRDYDKYKMGYLHYHGRNSSLTDQNLARVAERLGIGGREDNKKHPLPISDEDEDYKYKEIFELATHHLENGIRAYELRDNPEKYVLMFSYWDSNELFDLIPKKHDIPSAYYIAASTEPFNDEMQIDEGKFMKWLDKFHVAYDSEMKDDEKIFIRRHISGHASQQEIIELITKLQPKLIIPIHTEKPSLFKELFNDFEVTLPKYEGTIKL